MDWSKLDPNFVTFLGSLVAGAVGWLIHKAKGDKTQSARDILDSLVTQVIHSPGVNLDNVKARIEASVRPALVKIGIGGTISDSLVHEFVESGAALLHERFDAIDKEIQKRLDDLAAKAQGVIKAFDTPPIVPAG